MSEKNITQGAEDKGRRKRFINADPWAIGVFVAALIALFLVGYLGIRSMNMGFVGTREVSIKGWLKAIEKYPRRFMEEAFRGVQPRSKRVKEAKVYIQRGYILHRKSRFQEALGEYGKAIRLDPKNHEAYFFRGLTLIKTGEYDKAIRDFETVIELRDDFADAYDNLGWLHIREGNCDKGITYLTRSIELKPKNGWAYYNRGRCYFEKGERGKALEDLKRACELGYEEGCRLYEKYGKMQKS